MAQSKPKRPRSDPFKLPERSLFLDVVKSPVSVGALTAAALVTTHKLVGKSPIPWEYLPESVSNSPRGVWLTIFGYTAGYYTCKSAEWMRWKIIQKLLAYQGWVDAPRSMKTKAWGILMKIFKGPPTDTYTYQRYLPNQPLPDLDHTLDLWLHEAHNIVTKEEYEHTKEAVEQLRRNEGPKLQAHLQKRYKTEVNWLSEYWMTAAYLSSREPLAIDSNYALMHLRPDGGSDDPMARASECLHSMVEFYELVTNKRFPPVQLMDMVPLCMNGYRYIFNALRIPGENTDRLVRYPGETHIVVIRKGHYYRMDMYMQDGYKKRLLRTEEIKAQLKKICDHAEDLPEELPVAALTTMNRTKWAKLREILGEKNPETLKSIESSLFVFCIDEKAPADMNEHNIVSLCGRGNDRWFDKGVNAIIWPTSVFGWNIEHSGIDGMVMCTLAEHIMSQNKLKDGDIIHTPEGPDPMLPQPERLSWDVNNLKDEITDAYTDYIALCDKLEIQILNTKYGKGLMKKNKVSPDGYIQMAMQLAFYNMHRETPKTYEPATGRLYALGRTENLHPVSSMSKAWVRSMEDKSCTRQSRQDLLKRAVNAQNKARLQATIGQGCDRHLLGLYCASRELQMDVPALFMDKAWRAPFNLSTSQTPTRAVEFGANIDYKWFLGGFGPICKDGYGVAYVIMGEDLVNLNISSWKDSGVTSAKKFGDEIMKALDDMEALFIGTGDS